ncbi:uncharacterized protein METZ01_LOCUS459418, partial [marine metagenome]
MLINSQPQIFFALPVYKYYPAGKVKVPSFPMEIEQIFPTLILIWYISELLVLIGVMSVNTSVPIY